MYGDSVAERHRLTDPSIASVIFAPRHVNYVKYSVCSELKLDDIRPGLAFTEQEPAVDAVLKADRLTPWEKQEVLLRFMPYLLETSVTSKSSQGALAPAVMIPDRKWPSKSRFNILALPVREGMSFDLDEFVER
jgi:hypothetical protein